MKTEIVELDGKQFKYTIPSDGKLLKKIGTEEIYEEAYDILENNYEYEEIDKPEEGSEWQF
jgi:hypothetical protein